MWMRNEALSGPFPTGITSNGGAGSGMHGRRTADTSPCLSRRVMASPLGLLSAHVVAPRQAATASDARRTVDL
jgi:hypothetical protein